MQDFWIGSAAVVGGVFGAGIGFVVIVFIIAALTVTFWLMTRSGHRDRYSSGVSGGTSGDISEQRSHDVDRRYD